MHMWYFSFIEDKRYNKFVKHDLWKILGLVMCACLSGLDELQDIVDYGKVTFYANI